MAIDKNILLVDDELNLSFTLAQIIKRAGYCVTQANTAERARQCLDSQPFNLMILDLGLPDMDGLTLLPTVHCRFPKMPVFILTAFVTADAKKEAIENGACNYLLKPIDPAELISNIRATLGD
ncbi:MAG: response regulator [Anaerolineaceae bacterium]|nr:response regulator [Anaerolineaceae bacterium]